MASIITADDGTTSGTAGLKQTADSSGVLQLKVGNGTVTGLEVSATGQIGVGVTPASWEASTYNYKPIQLGYKGYITGWLADTRSYVEVGANAYYTTSAQGKYLQNGYATSYSQFDGAHSWYTAASGTAGNNITWTTAMVLAVNGYLGVGITNPTGSFANGNGVQLVPEGYVYANRTSASCAGFARNTSTGDIVGFGYGSTATNPGILGYISTNGSTLTYGGTSDYRLKEDVTPLQNGLDAVMRLKPVAFKWKNTGILDTGFLAHELQEVCPNAVTGVKDQVNEDGSIKPQMVDTSFLVATLTAAIQELAAEVAVLKAK